MTIDEAIKILTLLFQGQHPPKTLDEMAAVKLGIEALERVKDLRTKPSYRAEPPLPGETET